MSDEFDDVAIRQLFRLPEDGELFERLAEMQEDQIAGQVRLQNAVHNLLAEPVYEDGKMVNGIAVKFMMRLTLLAHEAGLKEYGKGNPMVAEALAVLGDPAENSPESLKAAGRRRAGEKRLIFNRESQRVEAVTDSAVGFVPEEANGPF